MRASILLLAACGSVNQPPPIVAAVPIADAKCALHHVHGVLLDGAGTPVSGVQIALAGGEGQDDTTTDTEGRFDIKATSVDRDHLVVFYVDSSPTQKLVPGRCDEQLQLRIEVRGGAAPVM